MTDASSEAIGKVTDRYGDISGNARDFAAALSTPLPLCVWANPLRLDRDNLMALLKVEDIVATPVPWSEHAVRLPHDTRPGRSWLYRAGLMQTQEEAALLSVRLLDPKPGERILDLCAAPGNKTAQIAIALGNRSTVLANDINVGRLAPLHAAISRLGLMNVSTTARSGTTYPAPDGFFDRVLADVPCSGEGTIRKGFGKHRPVPDDFRQWLIGTQRALLRRAIDLCRPGGRIVYSTCTFAPEENEGIVDHILRERPDDLRIIGTTIDNLSTAPGLEGWRDTRFHPDLAKAHRLWPHLTDTGGFFAILLERTGGPASPSAPPVTERHSPDAASVLQAFADHFGLPDHRFADLQIVHAGTRLRLLATDHDRPEAPPPIVSGLTLTRDRAERPKLSTQAAQAVGAQATRNVIDLQRDEIDPYFDQAEWAVDASRIATCDGPGHVMIRHAGHPLGIAALRNRNNVWIIDSLFPKGWG